MYEELVRSIGTNHFSSAAFSLLRDKLEVRHLTIARYSQFRPMELFAVECQGRERIFYPAIDYYMRGSYVGDPLLPYYSGSGRAEHLLFSVNAEEVCNLEVRERLYGSVGIAGKLSLIIRRSEDALTLSVYRSQDAGRFRQSDINMMRSVSCMLAATVERHVTLLSSAPLNTSTELGKLVAEMPRGDRLSKRETAVCAHIVAGHSTESIALNLGVSTHSVATYRQRAYAKLNISSQNELFLQLLGLCARRPCGLAPIGAFLEAAKRKRVH
jgi:DNA-binding CsgD family transcriptional regulator